MLKYYSKSDRRAIIVLSTIALLCTGGIILFGQDGTSPDDASHVSQSDHSKPTQSFERNSEPGMAQRAAVASQVEQPKFFDPNSVDSASLVALGLKPYQARSLIRYRNAGAVFRKPIDIARVYCLDDDDIDMLLPRIRISDKYRNPRTKYPLHEPRSYTHAEEHKDADTELHEYKGRSDKFTALTKVDVNTADTALLKRVPGIGPNIARWIVQRREKLGGFYSVEQLLEVKYFPEDALEWFDVKGAIAKKNIGRMTFREMASSPYIGYEKAKSISKYVRLYGGFKDAEALRESHIFTEEELGRLLPYLEF